MTDTYQQRAETVLKNINELATIGDDPTCLSRTFGTEAFLKGSQRIQTWMQEAGLQTRVDAIGNVRGRLVSKTLNARTLVIASHMDTVINAGKFDGPMGVLMGLDLLQHFSRTGKTLPFHIELIAFSDEEGVRFHTTYLGSKVVAGAFDEQLLYKQDEAGSSLGDVLRTMNCSVAQLQADAIALGDWLGYLEIHIEQGPVLYEANVPVAVVTAIAGQNRVEITFSGMAAHAGTVPMVMRQDALCAAAEFVLETERFALAHQHELVATVGKLTVANAASNVIPGEVSCSLDLRSHDGAVLATAYQALQALCHDVGRRRSVGVSWNMIQETKPVSCDAALTSQLAQAVRTAGYEVISLVSGAGHDGVPISAVSPIAMLFVRCYKGISHNPLEQVALADIAAALHVADQFIDQLIDHYPN